jgi:hypothetical protein
LPCPQYLETIQGSEQAMKLQTPLCHGLGAQRLSGRVAQEQNDK